MKEYDKPLHSKGSFTENAMDKLMEIGREYIAELSLN